MVTRRDVLALVEAGVAYEDVGRRLGIHPGLAYMIATGLPADGSGAGPHDAQRPGFVETSTQHLAHPAPVHNPTHHDEVQRWMHERVARDPQMRDAGSRDRPAPPALGQTGSTAGGDGAGDADVLSVLPRDHNLIRKLANRLQYTPSAAQGATADQIAVRAAAVEAIRGGLERHESAEDQHFWPFVRSKLANGGEIADAGEHQEQQGRELLGKLRDAEPGSDEFDELVERLQHALRAHVAYEDKVLLMLRTATTHTERVAVGRRIAEAEGIPIGSA